jgi:hypothetical protein
LVDLLTPPRQILVALAPIQVLSTAAQYTKVVEELLGRVPLTLSERGLADWVEALIALAVLIQLVQMELLAIFLLVALAAREAIYLLQARLAEMVALQANLAKPV